MEKTSFGGLVGETSGDALMEIQHILLLASKFNVSPRSLG
jgi:hypothetical protein